MIRYPRYLPHVLVVVFLAIAGYIACQPRVEASQPPPLPTTLLQKGHLIYEGAFRLPQSGFDGVGRPTQFNPSNGTLLMVKGNEDVVELDIPAIRTGTNLSDLAMATIRTTRPSMVRLQDLQCSEAHLLGGILPWGADFIASTYCYFEDGGEKRSHFRASGSTITGPFQVGIAGAGFVSGAMTPIPTEWQSALGGQALTSQWSIPIISRTSSGPAASVFNPADVGVKNPVPATQVVGYPIGHETLGALYTTTQWTGGVVFPPGTRTVLFFSGRKSTTAFCYGPGTTDKSLHGKVYPGAPLSETWCYDPVNTDKGTHGYPYAHVVYAYDVNDFVAVKNGTKQPWQISPHATWEFDLPFQYGQRVILGSGYDPATKRIFLTAENGDGYRSLVHVFKVNVAASVPPLIVVPPPVVIPPPVVTPPPPVVQDSPNCTNATALRALGSAWTIGTFQEQTLRDGVWVGGSHASTYLWAGGKVYIRTMAPDQHWAVWNGTTFIAAGLTTPSCGAAPLPPPPPPDADGDGVPDSADTCPAVVGPAPTGCPPVLPPPQVLTPLPIIATANVARAVTQCRITVPQFVGSPDGQLGWRLQIQRNGGSHGSAESSSPYGPSGGFTALVGVGSYVMTAKWTKPGQLTVTWQLGTQKCP